MVSGSRLSRNSDAKALPFHSLCRDHIPLPEIILDLKCSGLSLLLKMGSVSVTCVFNLVNQVNVTLEFLLLGLEVHDGLVSNPGKIF